MHHGGEHACERGAGRRRQLWCDGDRQERRKGGVNDVLRRAVRAGCKERVKSCGHERTLVCHRR
jgi:hypothetical protein